MNQNESDIAELTQEVLYILAMWKLTANQQKILLGISQLVNDILPDNEEVITRAQLLVAIDRSICLSFPHAPQLGRLWITTPSPLLADRNPLEIMLTEGIGGIRHIHALLDGVEF